jgi:hypothetical protein
VCVWLTGQCSNAGSASEARAARRDRVLHQVVEVLHGTRSSRRGERDYAES